MLQRRGAGEVRPGAEVRAGAAAGGPPHPPARRVQRPQLGQQGEGGWIIFFPFSELEWKMKH